MSEKFSTTQIAGGIVVISTLYNTFAPAVGLPPVDLGDEQVNALAVAGTVVLPSLYMMWRRTKKSALKWGFLK
jgi:hypothetical protein|tara:strand:+ start:1638 stop:1856 length:219 start_codon:yes stop_codon:yes gene_type:complete